MRTLLAASILLLTSAIACSLPRPHDTGAGGGDAAAVHAPPIPLEIDLATDSAYARCLRRPDSSTRYDEVEPYVASNPASPSMLLATWMVQSRPEFHPIRTAVSLDGGRTWSRQALVPFGPCGWTDPGLPASSDPWVAVDPAGRMYVGALVLGTTKGVRTSMGVAVAVSTDTGRTWQPAKTPIVERSTKFRFDNATIATHPRIPGTAYVLSTRFEASDPARPDTAVTTRTRRIAPAVISITRDGGATWSAPVAITPRFRGAWAGAPQLTVDARTGVLWVVYTTRQGDTLRVELVRSNDDGRSWSQPIPVVTYAPRKLVTYPGTQRELVVADDIIHLAIDATTRQTWVVFTDGRHSDGGAAQVSVTGSSDEGRTWSMPVRINEDPGTPSWRPNIVVRPRGAVVVTYLTPDLTRLRGAAPDTLRLPMRVEARRLTLESSSRVRLHPPQVLDHFDWGPTMTNEHFLGDYFGIVSSHEAVLVYSRTVREGNRVHAVRFVPP